MNIKIYLAIVFSMLWFGGQLQADISQPRKEEILKQVEAGDFSGDPRSEGQPFAAWIMSLTPEERKWIIPFARKKRDERNADGMWGLREEWNGLLAYLG